MEVFATGSGRVRGVRAAEGVVAVLGIPYAAPPFGADRFKAPRPAEPWAGVRDCTRFGPVAPQSAELPGAPVWAPGDEDVLSLNVWTPAPCLSPGPLPVLVWFHGGACTFGSSAQPDFDGTALARAGLVVVTVNYRLGFEGFGHVPASQPTPDRAPDPTAYRDPTPDPIADPAPAPTPATVAYPENRGLLDQVAALRWVRENIAGFGGDPDAVTVAGQSSGAASVACLMVMDRARGLFRRAIAHSPASPCYPPALAAATTRELAAAAGCPATAEGLTALSPEALVRAGDAVVERYPNDPGSGSRHYDPSLYAPVLDGDVLPVDPLTGMAEGRCRDVDLLVCHTTEEYWLLDAVGSCAEVATDERLRAFAADFGLPEGLVDTYRARAPRAPVREIYLEVFGDLLFCAYGERLADAHARAGGRARLARFDRRREGPDGPVRAWHCADVPFAFGTLHDRAVAFLVGGGSPTPADDELSARMVRAWADFARTGNPGWPALAGADTDTDRIMVWRADGDGGVRVRPEGTRVRWAGAEFPLLRA
ncbi:carboxylesterase family protein [Streptomyces sp. NPDC048659]|uniref:carboxylesterase/lipase family protein n=1 Tax=Streptomyces sp. NPDC048659 TaxID=3155489 RepID=UPI003436B8CC